MYKRSWFPNDKQLFYCMYRCTHSILISLKFSRITVSLHKACYQYKSNKKVTLLWITIYSISQEWHSHPPNEQGCLFKLKDTTGTLHQLALAVGRRGTKKINHFSIIWTLSDPCKLFKYALKTIQINNIYTHTESRYTDSKNESWKSDRLICRN